MSQSNYDRKRKERTSGYGPPQFDAHCDVCLKTWPSWADSNHAAVDHHKRMKKCHVRSNDNQEEYPLQEGNDQIFFDPDNDQYSDDNDPAEDDETNNDSDSENLNIDESEGEYEFTEICIGSDLIDDNVVQRLKLPYLKLTTEQQLFILDNCNILENSPSFDLLNLQR